MEDKSKTAENILEHLNDPIIKAYILFLKYSLYFFNNFNIIFQSRDILIHTLFKYSRQQIHQLGQNFLKLEALRNIDNLDLDDKNSINSEEDVYVGPECESFLESLELECAQEIRLKCLNFYITAVREMLTRLPFNDPFFEQLIFLDPAIALYDEGRQQIKDLIFIAKRINHVNLTRLAFEWRILPSSFNDIQKKELADLNLDEMWENILEYTNSVGEKIFSNLKSLVHIIFSLPHSNAEAERIFSMVTDIKDKKRNRLSADTVSSICVVRSSFQNNNINCNNFEVKLRHLELHENKNLYT